MDLDTLQTLLGWCLVLGYGLLLIWFFVYKLANDWIVGIHARMFDIDEAVVRGDHFRLMGQYKILLFVFVLAPWLALIIMGN